MSVRSSSLVPLSLPRPPGEDLSRYASFLMSRSGASASTFILFVDRHPLLYDSRRRLPLPCGPFRYAHANPPRYTAGIRFIWLSLRWTIAASARALAYCDNFHASSFCLSLAARAISQGHQYAVTPGRVLAHLAIVFVILRLDRRLV